MKRLAMLLVGALLPALVSGQINDPVRWAFSIRKISDNTFELHFTASILPPWHIYGQNIKGVSQELGLPTTISFNKNPLIEAEGGVKEVGNAEEKKIEGVSIRYYSGRLELIQVVKLKAAVKTHVTGKLDYMACTNTHCLPPAQRGFSLTLDNKQ